MVVGVTEGEWEFMYIMYMSLAVPTGRRHGKHSDLAKDKTLFISCSTHGIFFSKV